MNYQALENKKYVLVNGDLMASRYDEWVTFANFTFPNGIDIYVINLETEKVYPTEELPKHIQARARVCAKRLMRSKGFAKDQIDEMLGIRN